MSSFILKTPKGERRIGEREPCFIIAEMSANHGQDFDRAVRIIQAAAEAGADAIKLQTYTPDTMTIDSRKEWFLVGGKDNPEAWKGKTFYDLYKEAYTPWEWHAELKKIAEDLGLVFFSAPYDPGTVDFLETLDVPLYKIASYEATDIPFIRKVASTGKPTIMSVGFASLEEIEESVAAFKESGGKDLSILYCVTSYTDTPKLEETNLNTMLDLASRFQVPVGFSDNNGGEEIPVLAAAMGAAIIEKHFVLDENTQTALDGKFSLNKNGFKDMVGAIRRQEKIKGSVHYGVQNDSEAYNRQFRRSLFVIKDIKKGEPFTSENVRSIRPAYGLAPKHYDEVLTKVAAKDIERGTPLSFDLTS